MRIVEWGIVGWLASVSACGSSGVTNATRGDAGSPASNDDGAAEGGASDAETEASNEVGPTDGSTAEDGSSDANVEASDFLRDASTEDGSDASSTGCPAQKPGIDAMCTGSLACEYGRSVCCGVTSSASTCQCQGGSFSCALTVECNFVCPVADH